MKKVTIFYEASFGPMSQWAVEFVEADKKSITMKFPNSISVLFLNNSKFCVVCTDHLPQFDKVKEAYMNNSCFDPELRAEILKYAEGKILHYWNGKEMITYKQPEE